MRVALLMLLAWSLFYAPAQAQSVSENIPTVVIEGTPAQAAPTTQAAAATDTPAPAVAVDPYTITDVSADVTADKAVHARDKALMQAERTAYSQLCARLGMEDDSAKLNDDAIAALVQSFEVQSERLSAVRYIGVFTIRFKASAVQKKTGNASIGYKPALAGPFSHITIAVRANSLAEWNQIKRRLGAARTVAQIDTLSMGRGISHIDVSFAGSMEELEQELSMQNLALQQDGTGTWELIERTAAQ